MRNKLCLGLVFLLAMMLTGCTPDKEAMEKQGMKKQAIEKQIKKQVDEVVAALDSGKKAEDFKGLSIKGIEDLFIVGPGGTLLVHPEYVGQNLKTWRATYDAIVQATTEGLWVEYEHHRLPKRSYVKKTKGGLIVASGYFKS